MFFSHRHHGPLVCLPQRAGRPMVPATVRYRVCFRYCAWLLVCHLDWNCVWLFSPSRLDPCECYIIYILYIYMRVSSLFQLLGFSSATFVSLFSFSLGCWGNASPLVVCVSPSAPSSWPGLSMATHTPSSSSAPRSPPALVFFVDVVLGCGWFFGGEPLSFSGVIFATYALRDK